MLQDDEFLLLLCLQGVAGAAARLAVSERTLRRAAAATGTSLRALVTEYRLKSAEKLFVEGRPVSAVAASLGYAPGDSFRRFIRKECGVSPSVLRRRLLQRLDRVDGPQTGPSQEHSAEPGGSGRLFGFWPKKRS